MASADALWLPFPDVKPQQPSVLDLPRSLPSPKKKSECMERSRYVKEIGLVFSAD